MHSKILAWFTQIFSKKLVVISRWMKGGFFYFLLSRAQNSA